MIDDNIDDEIRPFYLVGKSQGSVGKRVVGKRGASHHEDRDDDHEDCDDDHEECDDERNNDYDHHHDDDFEDFDDDDLGGCWLVLLFTGGFQSPTFSKGAG